MTAPVRLDTVTLTDDFDFYSFIRSVLAGEPVIGSLPTDTGSLGWWARAWPIIESSGYTARIVEAVDRCLTDADPEVRRGAMSVFEDHPEGLTTRRVAELLNKHSALFDGVKDPWQGSIDLRWSLLRLLGIKMGENDNVDVAAVSLGQTLALDDTTSVQPLAAGLASAAPEWTSEHAAVLAKAAPGVSATILINLQRLGHDIRDVGKRMAAVMGHSRRFREDVKRFVHDPEAQREILAAARTQHGA